MKKKPKKIINIEQTDVGILAPTFIPIPYQIVLDTKLSFTDRFVYGTVLWFKEALANKRCTATNETIADIVKTTSKTVSNSLATLEDRGYIKRTFYDEKRRRRHEIIPLVDLKNSLLKVKFSVPPVNGTVPPVSGTKTAKTVPPMNGTVPPVSGTHFTPQKTEENVDLQGLNEEKGLSRVPPMGGERENIERIEKENLPIDPSGSTGYLGEKKGTFTSLVKAKNRYEKPEQIPIDELNAGIALFESLFPTLFVTDKPFAMATTRNAVRIVLMRHDLFKLANLISKYIEKQADPFRPVAASIMVFCNKIDQIEAYLGQRQKNELHAHRPISTPEQSKTRDEQYRASNEANREKLRKAKEEWLKLHPEEK